MTTRILVLRHAWWEGPGLLADAAEARGVEVVVRDTGEAGGLDDVDALVVMGGPMRATDVEAHPWIEHELSLIRAALDAGMPVLGICLGHQVLGLALGAELDPGATREIGVAPIDLVATSELGPAGGTLEVLHWHGDNVSLPAGAELLASTPGCPNQAFRLGSALGLQFHLEIGPDELATWLTEPAVVADLGGEVDAVTARLAATEAERADARAAIFGSFLDGVRARD